MWPGCFCFACVRQILVTETARVIRRSRISSPFAMKKYGWIESDWTTGGIRKNG